MNTVNKLLMTQSQFAVRRGVGRSAVTNWKTADLLVFAEDPAHPGKLLVDVLLTEARLSTKVDPTRGRPTTAQTGQLPLAAQAAAPADGGLGQVRSDLIKQQTIAKAFENARSAKTLVPVEEYERRSSELGRLTRERMYAIVRGTAERIAAERDPRMVTALLLSEIDIAFADMADQIAAGQLSAPDEGLDVAALDAAEAGEDADDVAEVG